jgi:hypothetical protein
MAVSLAKCETTDVGNHLFVVLLVWLLVNLRTEDLEVKSLPSWPALLDPNIENNRRILVFNFDLAEDGRLLKTLNFITLTRIQKRVHILRCDDPHQLVVERLYLSIHLVEHRAAVDF